MTSRYLHSWNRWWFWEADEQDTAEYTENNSQSKVQTHSLIATGWKYACICSRSWTFLLARNVFGCSCFHSFTNAFMCFKDKFRTSQIECVKKYSEFIWGANFQICFLFSKMFHSDTFSMDARQNLITLIPFCIWNFLFEFVDAWFVFLLFGSSQFNLEFFPLGDLDKNVKTFLDIVKYRPAHTFVFVLPSAESGVWTSWSPNSTYLHLDLYSYVNIQIQKT